MLTRPLREKLPLCMQFVNHPVKTGKNVVEKSNLKTENFHVFFLVENPHLTFSLGGSIILSIN